MKRYLIEDAKCGITDGGMACGPVSGSVIATVKFKEGDKSQYLSLAEVSGIPNFFLTDRDVYDDLIKEDFDDKEFDSYMNASYISDFNGVELGEYVDVLESIHEDPENPAVSLLRYIIALVRCPMEDVDGLVEIASGKYADELEIPISDVEEDYIEDLEDEDYDDEEEEEFTPPKGGKVYAVVSDHKENGVQIDPLPHCCVDEESAVKLIDEVWKDMTEEERSKYTEYRVVCIERYWSEVVGFVYSPDETVIKKYI